MLNTPAMFRWIGNKGGYLTDLAHNGIPVIPTKLIGQHDKPKLAEYVEDKPDGIVMKPSIAAKAYGLEFIRYHPSDKLYEVEIPQELQDGQRPYLKKMFFDACQLQAHFEEYSKKHRSNKLTRKQMILLQDMVVQKLELSCIMIRGMKPYYIKRAEGLHTKVAHEAFGGENRVEPNPGNDLERFAEHVRNAMPDHLREETIIRIDILKCPDKLILLEIETGSLRLFNEKKLANNSDQYAGILAQVAKNSYILLRKHTHRKGAVNQNLAPTTLILS